MASGGYPGEHFNENFISRYILSEIWGSCRGGANVHDDPEGAGQRREQNKTKGNRKGRRKIESAF